MPTSVEMYVLDEFLAEAAVAQSRAELNASLVKAVRKLGFDRINISTIRDIELPPDQQQFAQTCDYPIEWLLRYQRKNYIEVDPVALRARSGVRPFFWDDLSMRGDLTRVQLQVLGEAREARLYHGIGLPFLGSPGLRGGIALAVSHPDMEHSTCLHLLWGMSTCYYQMFKQLTISDHTKTLNLAPRESQVASMMFAGKSNPQISRALGSSRHTIDHQVRQIFSKIGVHSRAEAIFRAISCGLYDPK